MKTIPPGEIARRLVPFIERRGCEAPDGAKLLKIVLILRERTKTLKDMAQMAEFFFKEDVGYEAKARDKYLTPTAKPILERFLRDFSALPSLDGAQQKSVVEGIAKDFGKKLVEVVQPVRVALSGREVTPGIFEVIEILGKETVEKRIERAISSIA
jgi:glutamyl-tRNA synthetase